MPTLRPKVKVKAVCKDKDGNIKWIQETEIEIPKDKKDDNKCRTELHS